MAEYISRDDLLNVINANVAEAHNERCSQLLEAILNAPAADVVKVKHSEWKINCDGYYPYCDNCKTEPKNGVLSNYCPECGAKMDSTPKERGGEK